MDIPLNQLILIVNCKQRVLAFCSFCCWSTFSFCGLSNNFEHCDYNKMGSMFSKISNDFECSICKHMFVNVNVLNCSHQFCEVCVEQARQRSGLEVCPQCQVPILNVIGVMSIDNIVERHFETKSNEEQEARRQLVAERNAMMTELKQQRQLRSWPTHGQHLNSSSNDELVEMSDDGLILDEDTYETRIMRRDESRANRVSFDVEPTYDDDNYHEERSDPMYRDENGLTPMAAVSWPDDVGVEAESPSTRPVSPPPPPPRPQRRFWAEVELEERLAQRRLARIAAEEESATRASADIVGSSRQSLP